MSEEKKKSWFRRHWILTIILAPFVMLFILGIIIGIASNSNTQTPSNTNNDVWSKTSGYTVDDCNIVCESAYDLQVQVDICQGNCNNIYGKPSASLDKYVNKIKDIKNNKTS